MEQVFRNIHPLFHFYQFSECMGCAIFQINTNLLKIQRNVSIFTQEILHPFFISEKNSRFLTNYLQNYFYTKHLRLLLHFQKNFALSVEQVLRNIHFLSHASQFSQRMNCTIFQMNNDLLVIYQNINNFKQEDSYPSFISKKKQCSPSQSVFGTFIFYRFLPFLKVSEVCNISS